MKEKVKHALKRMHLLDFARKINFLNFKSRLRHKKKQQALLSYKKLFPLNIFIETGTYQGDMVFAMKSYFERIYSIELGRDLYENAVNRFKNEKHIVLLNGDSGELLKSILPQIHEPCLFWLDAHYSAGITAKGSLETPIIEELAIILNHSIKGHVILIDDARLFNGEDDYPKMDDLKKFILERSTDYQIAIDDDIIRVSPIKAVAAQTAGALG